MKNEITEIFYLFDEFCKESVKVKMGHLLEENTTKKRRIRKFKMPDSETITIVVYFHCNGYRCFKHFYIEHIQKHMTSDFPQTISYKRFVELQQKAVMPMIVFLRLSCLGECTRNSFIHSTPIRACQISWEHQHKTFKGPAIKGKCSMGWFFGFKLHIVINDKGEILDFLFTQADVDDREPLKNKIFMIIYLENSLATKDIFRKLYLMNFLLMEYT